MQTDIQTNVLRLPLSTTEDASNAACLLLDSNGITIGVLWTTKAIADRIVDSINNHNPKP